MNKKTAPKTGVLTSKKLGLKMQENLGIMLYIFYKFKKNCFIISK